MASKTQTCSVCGGTGWKPVERDGVRSVAPCKCRTEVALEKRLAAARIPPRYRQCDFASFQVNIHRDAAYNDSLRAARFQAEKFAAEFVPGQVELSLLFMGPCGVGKTHLAVALLGVLLEKGVDCLFYDFRELLKEIQNSYNPVSQTTELQVLSPVLDTEVLLLDDLGASKPSAWVLDTVAHILNSRYNDKRVTLITTNYMDTPASRPPGGSISSEDSLTDRIGERIRSRLYEMCRVVEMKAPDFRREVRQARYHLS